MTSLFITARIYGKLVDRYPQLARFVSLRGWQIKRTGEQYELRKGGVTLVLDYLHARTMAAEILAWERLYLPAFSLKGKTVLDIGAGAGETAQFYLSHGAEMIIAVEPTRDAFECLKANAERNHWNAELHNEAFNLRHLNIEHDFMKMDCEGCEALLLNATSIKPCVIEIHSDEVASKLQERFGMERLQRGLSKTSIWVSGHPARTGRKITAG